MQSYDCSGCPCEHGHVWQSCSVWCHHRFISKSITMTMTMTMTSGYNDTSPTLLPALQPLFVSFQVRASYFPPPEKINIMHRPCFQNSCYNLHILLALLVKTFPLFADQDGGILCLEVAAQWKVKTVRSFPKISFEMV